MSALKRFAGYLALATVVPFAMLLMLEGLTSIGMLAHEVISLQPPAKLPHTAHDSLLGWVGQPNVVLPNYFGPNLSLTHDAAGMRVHRPVAEALASGEHRIICSGGALTYGAGVADSQTMCAYLEQELPGVRTLDMTQEGFGIDQAYLWYRRDGDTFPHQLHVFAFTRSDFDRMAQASYRGYAKPVLVARNGSLAAENVPLPGHGAASRWSRLPSVLSDSRLLRAIDRRTGWTESNRAREDAESWKVAQAVFRDLARLNEARGSEVVLVYLPTLNDLRAGPNDGRRAALATFSRESAIPFIDLTIDMRAVSADSTDWFFITPNALPVGGLAGHYSAVGHRWTAAHLAERLRAIPDVARALGTAR
jgi:hypothetical protein